MASRANPSEMELIEKDQKAQKAQEAKEAEERRRPLVKKAEEKEKQRIKMEKKLKDFEKDLDAEKKSEAILVKGRQKRFLFSLFFFFCPFSTFFLIFLFRSNLSPSPLG